MSIHPKFKHNGVKLIIHIQCAMLCVGKTETKHAGMEWS